MYGGASARSPTNSSRLTAVLAFCNKAPSIRAAGTIRLMPDLLLLAILVYPILVASVFVHELGHAILARLVGFAVHSFGVGLARPFWVFSLRGTRVFFGLRHITKGLTFSQPSQVLPPRWRLASYYAGGSLANLLCALAAVGLLILARHHRACVLVAGFTVFWNVCVFLGIFMPICANLGPFRL